ncbi:Crp/Fnr family transcriptional regulator [Bacillus salacetis]|uniref:Crp/Fnr family transcriptional regulator n=1 Tax=Bacillus salacetis TaxID=2315464 RepID=UPI003B9FFEAF
MDDKKLLYLSEINLFEELPLEELKGIGKISKMESVTKGSKIISSQNPPDSLFVLKEGQVRLYIESKNNKQFTIDILGPGNIFGETTSFSITDHNVFAESMSEVILCTITKNDFEEFISQNPRLAIRFIEILSSRLNEVYATSELIANREVRYRLLFLLMRLSEKFGKRKNEWQTIEVKITHNDLGTMIGSTRETVSALISQLKKEGIVARTPTGLKIHAKRASEELD